MDGNRPYTDTGFDMYNDIKLRTNGEIYLGVVGPVRTGKSTFIRRFMEMCVLPVMQDENEKRRAVDELPQASGGTTIMTTEPKFIPKEAALISPYDDICIKVRLVDCVGYMINGANGHMENGVENGKNALDKRGDTIFKGSRNRNQKGYYRTLYYRHSCDY